MQVENMVELLMNYSYMQNVTPENTIQEYVMETHHAIGLDEIVMAAAGFIFLSYWLIRVTKEKEYYSKWINPSGNEINLYKKVRVMFYIYTATIIVLGLVQIYLNNGI